jgi:hypothetical protein
MTMTAAAALYIAAAPVGGGAGPVTITNSYALWVDSGTSRFDGRWNLSKVTSISSGGTMTFGAGVYQEITTDGGDVNYITTTGWTAGSFVIMRNNSATTIALNHNAGSVPGGTAALNMTGGAAVTWGVNDCILMMYDGTRWTQITAQLSLSVA